MKAVDEIILRMIDAAKTKNMAEMLRFCGFGKSSGSTWKKRKKIPEGSLARVVNKTGCNYDWLLTGDGEMYSSGKLREQLDEPRDGYSPHPDGAALFDRVNIRLEQAEIVMLSESRWAVEMEAAIKKIYDLYRRERQHTDPGARSSSGR